MKDFGKINIPVLSVDKCVETLSQIYISAYVSGSPFKRVPSVMLWGAPGVGKSQLVRQMASEIEGATGKTCVVTDVRLLLFNPIDLRGIPTANADKTLAVWLKPKIFQMDESDDVINILFLDEISAAPQSVQASAYQITLDRVVGEHKLPDNCIVIGAGNRLTDKSVSYKMPKALSNRLCHLEIESNFESWKRWAINSGISPKVVGFLSFRPDLLIENDNASDNHAFPTPRSWEMVSNLLHLVGDDQDMIYSLIAGCIGGGVATEFCSWCRVFSKLPPVEDIFLGKYTTVPRETDVLYALISAMTAYAREHKDNSRLIDRSASYAMGLPADFSVVLLKNYMAIDENYKMFLMGLPNGARWVSSKGKFLNGT